MSAPQSSADSVVVGGEHSVSSCPAAQMHPFVVVVRCRGLSEREKRLGKERFPRRIDTGYCSVRCGGGLPTDHHTAESMVPSDVPTATVETAKHQHVVTLTDPDSAYDARHRYDRCYEFDRVFDERATNAQVYAYTVAPLVAAARRGFNGTCFAYGMTGAGKTYTMTGDASKGVAGICSLAISDLFSGHASRIENVVIQTVHLSYVEVYNERLRDLLYASPNPPPRLDVVEDPERGVLVTNIVEKLVTSAEQLELLIMEGASRRVMAETNNNSASSRSHALLQLTVRRQASPPADQSTVVASQLSTGRLLLIDLAGSERAVVRPSASSGAQQDPWALGGTTAKEHQRLNQLRSEGGNINKSLLALGACITALGSSSGGGAAAAGLSHVPYRDSKLTRLLKESLGGNTRTAMIAAISPSVLCYEESLSTLKYASRARLITRAVRRNVITTTTATAAAADEHPLISKGYDELIAALAADVAGLRAQLALLHQHDAVRLQQIRHHQRNSAESCRGASSEHCQRTNASEDLSPPLNCVDTTTTPPSSRRNIRLHARLRLADMRAQLALLERAMSNTNPDAAETTGGERSREVEGPLKSNDERPAKQLLKAPVAVNPSPPLDGARLIVDQLRRHRLAAQLRDSHPEQEQQHQQRAFGASLDQNVVSSGVSKRAASSAEGVGVGGGLEERLLSKLMAERYAAAFPLLALDETR